MRTTIGMTIFVCHAFHSGLRRFARVTSVAKMYLPFMTMSILYFST